MRKFIGTQVLCSAVLLLLSSICTDVTADGPSDHAQVARQIVHKSGKYLRACALLKYKGQVHNSFTLRVRRLHVAGHEFGVRQTDCRLPDGQRDRNGGQQTRCIVHRQHLLSADQFGLYRTGSDEEQQTDDAVHPRPRSAVHQQGSGCDGSDMRTRHHVGQCDCCECC